MGPPVQTLPEILQIITTSFPELQRLVEREERGCSHCKNIDMIVADTVYSSKIIIFSYTRSFITSNGRGGFQDRICEPEGTNGKRSSDHHQIRSSEVFNVAS